MPYISQPDVQAIEALPPEAVLTALEVARLLRVSTQMVYKLKKQGKVSFTAGGVREYVDLRPALLARVGRPGKKSLTDPVFDV